MWTSTLEELNPKIVKTRTKIEGGRIFSHTVTAVVLNQTYSVHPQFGTVVRVEVEGPISSIWYVNEAAKASAPVLLEAVIKS